jgi:hypothetical protein
MERTPCRLLSISVLMTMISLSSGVAVANTGILKKIQLSSSQGMGSSSQSGAQGLRTSPYDDWHEGTNQSTPEAYVNYTVGYASTSTGQDKMVQDLTLSYRDPTRASVKFEFTYSFSAGGLDITNHRVLDWKKLHGIHFNIYTTTTVKGTLVSTLYSPDQDGLTIIAGSARNLILDPWWSTESYRPVGTVLTGQGYSIQTPSGFIIWTNATMRFGAVTMSSKPYIYGNRTMNESIATFNVTMANASIGHWNGVYGSGSATIMANMSAVFMVRHAQRHHDRVRVRRGGRLE